jgi:hypothetical protein
MKLPLFCLLLAGGSLVVAAAETAPAFAWVELSDPSAAVFRQAGEQAISRIGNTLIFEVEHSLAENGLAKTLEVVHLKNFVTPKPGPGQPRITAIRRTSLNLRNPANAPDAADRAALERFNTAIHEGDVVPALLVQRLDAPGAAVEWRVYRPISTMPQCLKCHGPVEGLAPEVREYLHQHYPADQATGYTPYQWRGIIRVSLAAADPAPAK